MWFKRVVYEMLARNKRVRVKLTQILQRKAFLKELYI